MTASNFTFLESTYPKLFLLAELAERSIWTDPANTLTKLRILSEKICLYLLEYEGIEHYEEELDKKVTGLGFGDGNLISAEYKALKPSIISWAKVSHYDF